MAAHDGLKAAAGAFWQRCRVAFADPADKLAELMREAEDDVFAYMAFPKDYSTNPLERLNKEIKRCTNVDRIFPTSDAIIRPVVTRRYMSLETVAQDRDDHSFDVARIAAL